MIISENAIRVVKACKTSNGFDSIHENVINEIGSIVGIHGKDLTSKDILFWLEKTVEECQLTFNLSDIASHVQRKILSNDIDMWHLFSLALEHELRNMTITEIENYW